MATIAFIGLGNMGGPMARNLLKAGHAVRAFDLNAAAMKAATDAGAAAAGTVADAVAGAGVVVTMLPAGKQVREVYGGPKGVFAHAAKGSLCIDCSTIDVDSARAVQAQAAKAGFAWIDAPVSGGTTGAEAATLTFMVGGLDADFAQAEPFLKQMGKTIIHAGKPGSGQAAKICNNMILGISMIAVSEAFALAEKLGLDKQKLFDVSSKSSGQCWSLTSYCPEPGLVPTAPSNRDYKPGFSVDMMLKDLKLSQQCARAVEITTPLGQEATALYAEFQQEGGGAQDFSAIINMLKGYDSPAKRLDD